MHSRRAKDSILLVRKKKRLTDKTPQSERLKAMMAKSIVLSGELKSPNAISFGERPRQRDNIKTIRINFNVIHQTVENFRSNTEQNLRVSNRIKIRMQMHILKMIIFNDI